ncbi:MAG: SIMPL domain-containing protein [Acidobacteriota bacterium]
MRKTLSLIFPILLFSGFVVAQESGNRAYGTQKRKPTVNSGVLTGNPDGKALAYFVEANVLMNVKADSYTAVFGVVQEGLTSTESGSKTDAAIASFTKELDTLGIKRSDIFVDFITQNKIYDYAASGSTVTEKFSGFETKKNVEVRYRDREVLDKVLAAASRASIYDLIEVDYTVSDVNAVHAKLYDEAVKVIKQKEASYTNSFGIKLAPTNLANEKYDAFFPSDLYSNYQAYEAGNTYGDYNNRVVQARKTRTFFYDPLNASDFDAVINQIGIEPMVQFTLYMKMQYDLGAKK